MTDCSALINLKKININIFGFEFSCFCLSLNLIYVCKFSAFVLKGLCLRISCLSLTKHSSNHKLLTSTRLLYEHGIFGEVIV